MNYIFSDQCSKCCFRKTLAPTFWRVSLWFLISNHQKNYTEPTYISSPFLAQDRQRKMRYFFKTVFPKLTEFHAQHGKWKQSLWETSAKTASRLTQKTFPQTNALRSETSTKPNWWIGRIPKVNTSVLKKYCILFNSVCVLQVWLRDTKQNRTQRHFMKLVQAETCEWFCKQNWPKTTVDVFCTFWHPCEWTTKYLTLYTTIQVCILWWLMYFFC